MKGYWTRVLSLTVILLGISAVYFWLLVIEEYGFPLFLGVLVVSWILNLAVGETETEGKTILHKTADTVKNVVGFFAYSTLATAILVVLYHGWGVGSYLLARFTEFLDDAVRGYQSF